MTFQTPGSAFRISLRAYGCRYGATRCEADPPAKAGACAPLTFDSLLGTNRTRQVAHGRFPYRFDPAVRRIPQQAEAGRLESQESYAPRGAFQRTRSTSANPPRAFQKLKTILGYKTTTRRRIEPTNPSTERSRCRLGSGVAVGVGNGAAAPIDADTEY